MTHQKRQDKPDRDEPKLVVDEDWKAQAEAERKRLSQVEQSVSTDTARQEEGARKTARSLPEASFTVLVSSLMTQVLFALGMIEDPNTHKRYRDLELAKHNIDMLAMLEEKTKGNLTEQEKRALDEALYEVRMAYVRVAQGAGG